MYLNLLLLPPRVIIPYVSCINSTCGETVVRHSNTVASPAELVLHYHCLDINCIGVHEDTGVGAAIFPADT